MFWANYREREIRERNECELCEVRKDGREVNSVGEVYIAADYETQNMGANKKDREQRLGR
jgi:hypothetical protein